MKFNNRLFLKILSVLAVFFIVVLILNYFVLPWYVSGEMKEVPAVEGQNISRAFEILQEAGFSPVVSDTMPQPKKPSGIVLNQRPAHGESVKVGRRIHLVITGGAPKVMVPDLKGKSLSDARLMLERANLELGSIEIVEIKENRDKILTQQYAAGTFITEGTKVGVSISKGQLPGTITVPVLTGKLLSEAESILTAIDLKVGKINFQPSFQLAPNTIIDQYPAAGSKMNPGDKVELFVTKEAAIPEEANTKAE